MIGDAVMRLVECHCNEGHSGYSHELSLLIFSNVIRGKALTAKYWDEKKAEFDLFAKENMGEPWKDHILKDMIGERPKEG